MSPLTDLYSSYPRVPRLGQCEGSVGGPYMPYTAPPPSPNLLTDGASPSSSPHFFVDNPHGPIYPLTPSVGTCGGMCPASPYPSWSFSKSRIRRVALLWRPT